MLREETEFARKIIDFYADRGLDCTVVDERSSLLVTLAGRDRTHKFRCGGRAFAGRISWKKFYAGLESEYSKMGAVPVYPI